MPQLFKKYFFLKVHLTLNVPARHKPSYNNLYIETAKKFV